MIIILIFAYLLLVGMLSIYYAYAYFILSKFTDISALLKGQYLTISQLDVQCIFFLNAEIFAQYHGYRNLTISHCEPFFSPRM